MSEEKQKKLLQQIEKLNRYITQYASREHSVHTALGTTGSNLLVSVFTASEELKMAINDEQSK